MMKRSGQWCSRKNSSASRWFATVMSVAGLSACGDDGGGGDDGGESGNVAPIDGEQCGEVEGWNTECFYDDAVIRFGSSSNENNAQTLSNPLPPQFVGNACCEGLASEPTADGACEDLCQRKLCESAQSLHHDIAGGLDGLHICADTETCGFSKSACETGNWHKQQVKFLVTTYEYWMRARCANARTNVVFDDGHFAWREVPTDIAVGNPLTCEGPADLTKDPKLVAADDIAVQDAGTVATVTWTMGSSNGVEESDDATVRFAYDVHDCATSARCLDLAELHVSLPPMTIEGIAITDAHLVVYEVSTKPVVQSSGAFSYGPGSMRAIVSAVAAGMPIMLSGPNVGTASGRLTPAADTLTLSGLKFDYSDSMIAAQLQLDIVGDYIQRAPTAVIVPLNVPRQCNQPVTFRAASSDADGGSLSHLWWVPNRTVSTGSTLDIVLAPGTHKIALVSGDPTGHLDAVAITYTRSCS